jgi:hypothetical protein
MRCAKEGQLQSLTQQPVLQLHFTSGQLTPLSVSRATTFYYEENLADMLAPTT